MKIISLFVNHKLAAMLTMMIMILAGIWALSNLNVGLNSPRKSHQVDVSIIWRSASAEDVEKLITNPLEQQLRSLPKVKFVRSTTRDANALVSVEMDYGTDMQRAVDDVKQRVSQIRSFPVDIEPPIIRLKEYFDQVASVLIQSKGGLDEISPLAQQLRTDLLNSGADMVTLNLLPKQEIAIQVPAQTLFELGISFNELGLELTKLSQDAPGGTVGSGQMSRQIRSLDQRRDAAGFNDLPFFTSNGDNLMRLGDFADIEKRPVVDQPYATVGGQPAVQMMVQKNIESSALDSARMLSAWVEKTNANLPEGIVLSMFAEAWVFIQDELDMIFDNGFTGLALVILALLIFLQLRVAFWVMVGIPVTFLGALLVYYYLGGTINAISLIGVIMALGIVVDDAIVVGEESLTQFQQGKSPGEAAILGANRMLFPVIASSLTTLCAFIPLLASSTDEIIEIPIMMLCVIAASLVECFLVLPGHLKSAFEKSVNKEPGEFRQRFNAGFNHFRENTFRSIVRMSMSNRRVVISGAFSLFVLSITLWNTGWIKTKMGLNLNIDTISANMQFVGGTSHEEKQAFIAYLESSLNEVDEKMGGKNLVSYITNFNTANISNETKTGSQYARIWVEMISPEQRSISSEDFAVTWLQQVDRSHVIDSLTIKKENRYWGDFAILLKSRDIENLKRASEEMVSELSTLEGVINIHDDLPYGKEQWIFRLTTEGRSLGLTTADVGRQLRAAYDGQRIQIFQQEQTEIEVRLLLPERERTDLGLLGQFPIKTPSGEMLPLRNVATWEGKRGIDVIRHHNAERTIKISGDVDLDSISGSEVVEYFDNNIKERLQTKYGITSGLDDMSLAEQESGSDFMTQFLVALTLIYIVLAWIFSSYSWPLAVMAAIPLGLTGAVLGHFILGIVIGPMSMLGLFTLTGIIVNDSIILVSSYKNFVEDGVAPQQAIEDAVCSRLRAVILTSLTTIAGLFPLLLETVPMAAAFIPLAVAICFGMLYGTILVLLVIPALLSSVITITEWFAAKGQRNYEDVQYNVQ